MAEPTKLQAQSMAQSRSGISVGKHAVYSITKADAEPDTNPNGSPSGKPWAFWGKRNNDPQIIIDENMAQETSSGALLFKIQAHYGKGLFFHTKEIDEKGNEKNTPVPLKKLDKEIKDFYYNNDLENFSQGIITDFEWFNFYYSQYIPNKLGNKIVRVDRKRTKDVRSALREKSTGNIPAYFLSGSWPDPKESERVELPVFNPLDPFKHPNAIKKHQLVSIDRDYYPTAYWQSNFEWLKNAKSIPAWVAANIRNSANIKYHVEIPEQYFIDLYPIENYPNSLDQCLAARKAAEEDIKKQIDDCLAGEVNVSKIFYSKFAVDADGKAIPGWKITPLTNELKDSAWLSAYDTAAAAICTAHGVDPSLSGLRMSKSLNVGSGSDTREKFNFYIQLKTVIPRQTTLEVWETVKRINQWDEDIHLGFRDVFLETTDKSKTGTVIQNE